MTELKTFQDLVFYEHLTDAQRNEAREEAIKWIKASDFDITECVSQRDDYSDLPDSEVEYTRMFIKHLFNITNGDLK